MTFTPGRSDTTPCQVSCAEFIVAEGEIVPESQAAFLALWSSLPRKDLPVILASQGGRLDAALDLGRAFRRLKVAVTVGKLRASGTTMAGVALFERGIGAAPCHSACVYAFSGGAERNLAAGSALGVHQFYMAAGEDTRRRPRERYSSADVGNLQRTFAGLATYLAEMQIHAGVLALAAETTPHRMRTLSLAEAQAFNLVTSPPSMAAPLSQPATDLRPALAANSPASASGGWPMVQQGGRPWLVLTTPAQSRRFGIIANQISIGCPADQKNFVATFREILPRGPVSDAASARIATGPGGDAFVAMPGGGLRGAISEPQAREAQRAGTLELEVVSLATAHYPMRVAFDVTGLGDALERLQQACAR